MTLLLRKLEISAAVGGASRAEIMDAMTNVIRLGVKRVRHGHSFALALRSYAAARAFLLRTKDVERERPHRNRKQK